MKDTNFKFDMAELDKYFKKLDDMAKKDFKQGIAEWFEACGYEFLDVVQDEIIRREVVDTRQLLHSFHKGKDGNIWKSENKGLTLTVGTDIDYAVAVNDGHWTCAKGEIARWVPGFWKGDRFYYQKGAKTGMLLKQQWIEGRHYWEGAIKIFEKMFNKSLENKMEEWKNKYWR